MVILQGWGARRFFGNFLSFMVNHQYRLPQEQNWKSNGKKKSIMHQ